MYADYSYYATEYFGNSIAEEDFPRLATRASDYIDNLSLTRRPDGNLDAVKKCCCALAERYQIIERARATLASGTGELQSESVGAYSRSYRSGAETAAVAEAELGEIARSYLLKTGLLYRGGVCCVRSPHGDDL